MSRHRRQASQALPASFDVFEEQLPKVASSDANVAAAAAGTVAATLLGRPGAPANASATADAAAAQLLANQVDCAASKSSQGATDHRKPTFRGSA